MSPVSQTPLVFPGFCDQASQKDCLRDLYSMVDQSFTEDFESFKKEPAVYLWLSQLSNNTYYRTDNKIFASELIGYLEKANQDKEFRLLFFSIIKDVSTFCKDEMTLSVLLLDLAYTLATADIYYMQQLADFIHKGVWTVNILKEVVCKKISSSHLCNESKVFLECLIRLGKDLSIPVNIEHLHNFSCNELTEKDIQDTKEAVLSRCNNKEEYIDFLSGNKVWQKALAANYEREFDNIENLRAEVRCENNLKSNAHIKIDQKIQESLKSLTQKALLKKGCDFYFS